MAAGFTRRFVWYAPIARQSAPTLMGAPHRHEMKSPACTIYRRMRKYASDVGRLRPVPDGFAYLIFNPWIFGVGPVKEYSRI